MKNPITALFDLFSKFVNEHGSAIIQEKQITLLKDQSAILERENTKLTISLEKSEAKNQIFETENKALKKENMELKKKVDDREKILIRLARYERKQIAPGVFVRALKGTEKGAEPEHWLCDNCYTDEKESTLQYTGPFYDSDAYRCHKCNKDIFDKNHLLTNKRI